MLAMDFLKAVFITRDKAADGWTHWQANSHQS